MNICFNLDELSIFITKAELGFITPNEHSYLQKLIAAQTVINQYKKNFNTQNLQLQKIIYKYYRFVCNNLDNKKLSKKDLSDLFLLKNSLEKFNYTINNKDFSYEKPLSNFNVLCELAKIWNFSLSNTLETKVQFLQFLMQQLYGIPDYLGSQVMDFVLGSWKPVLSPLGSIVNKKYSLKEIEDYFFGENFKPEYQKHIVEHIDRFFSLVGSDHPNHVFLSKETDFDIFEAALVVHEFQHILDATQNKMHTTEEKLIDHLYFSEKSAMNAERIFLLAQGTSKRGRFAWLESNLLYPLILLKCELQTFTENEYAPFNFQSICRAHGMEPIGLSSLFNWGAPFQMSVYCAVAMELEQNWQKYIQ